MLQLLRVQVSTDWKGRPDVHVVSLMRASYNGRSLLITAQNADIAALQQADMDSDREMLEPGEEPATEWKNSERWEMDRKDPNDLRVLCGKHDDGGTWSTTYHLIDVGS